MPRCGCTCYIPAPATPPSAEAVQEAREQLAAARTAKEGTDLMTSTISQFMDAGMSLGWQRTRAGPYAY